MSMQSVPPLHPPLALLDPPSGRVAKPDDLQREDQVTIVDRIVIEQLASLDNATLS